VYDFKGWVSPVTCCVASPALDIVAVGCADGTIHLHNLRFDEERMSFSHSIRGAVTSLSFRTGNLHLIPKGFVGLLLMICAVLYLVMAVLNHV
jgi:U3 small nucleolar RNA-associated protein 21